MLCLMAAANLVVSVVAIPHRRLLEAIHRCASLVVILLALTPHCRFLYRVVLHTVGIMRSTGTNALLLRL